MTESDAKPDVPEKKHPKGLGMLFFAEMWERFSFYGMRGLLVLYLAQVVYTEVEDPDEVAYAIYGAYGALVYATPFVGGLLADRILGYKKAVMLGAVLMALGHAAMAIENELFLYIALAFLIVGNGFFKPNISSMVGGLYEENDPRRDRGFTIFYMGINLGALLQLVPGWLGKTYSWSIGFGLAGVGMLIGLGVFWWGKSMLKDNGDPPDPARLKKKIAGFIPLEQGIYALAFVSVPLFASLVYFNEVMDFLLPAVAAAGFLSVLIYALRSEKVVRDRLFVVLVLTMFNIVFWTFFEQAGSSINLFTERNVDRYVGDWSIATPVFQSVNPTFIVLLAPLFALIWRGMNKLGAEPSMPVKFSLGLMQLGLGFLVMVWAVSLAHQGQVEVTVEGETVIQMAAVVPLWVLFAGYLFHTTGELCLSPIGLSMVTKLSPKKIVAMVMGLWFLATSLSHHVAAAIASFTSLGAGDDAAAPGRVAVETGLIESTDAVAANLSPEQATELLTSYDQLASYMAVFEPVGWIAVGAGVALLFISPLLKKWQHGVE